MCFQQPFHELIHSFHSPTICFTDGSKTHNRTGFACLIRNSTYAHRHRNTASVYTCELQAILNCLEHILRMSPSPSTHPFLIVSDSLASLNALSQPSTSHPLISHIQILLETCSSASIPVVFIWVLGQNGIPGNEIVDKAAKQVSQHPTLLKSLLPSGLDLFSHINKTIRHHWFANWENEQLTGNKLAQQIEVNRRTGVSSSATTFWSCQSFCQFCVIASFMKLWKSVLAGRNLD